MNDQKGALTRSGSSMSDKKSISMGPRSSSNAGLDSAKVYRIAATTVARLVGFVSLMRFYTLVRITAAINVVVLTWSCGKYLEGLVVDSFPRQAAATFLVISSEFSALSNSGAHKVSAEPSSCP